MAELARTIEVGMRAGVGLTIDGEPFPWHTVGGAHVDVSKGEHPAVTITIPCKSLTVTDTLEGWTKRSATVVDRP